jgi:translation elongation factor EF-Ts
LAQTKEEGKPEQAWTKIVEGKLGAWAGRQGQPEKGLPGGALLEQGWFRDEKQKVPAAVAPATVVRFAQVLIG